jgi:ATP-dependent DNA helicase DinG
MELSIPEAVMKFKQGFGRLMRSSTDYGVVVVLDSRLTRKSYGKYFLNSLPKTRRCFANQETVIQETGIACLNTSRGLLSERRTR